VGIIDDPPGWEPAGLIVCKAARHGGELISHLTYGAETYEHMEGEMPVYSRHPNKRFEMAKLIFWSMMEWASHMNIPAVILPPIPDLENQRIREHNQNGVTICGMTGTNINCAAAKQYARLIANLATSPICASSHVQLWVRVPLRTYDMQAFQLLLTRCDHASCVGCMLHIDRPLDAAELPNILRELHPFLGGGFVKAISWDTCVFVKNKKGFPTLSKSHQFLFSFLYGRLGRTLRTLVEGKADDSSMQWGGSSSRLFILQYLQHLRLRDPLPAKLDSEEALLETSYLDTLQSPLQPLGDHLEYQTYETFEKDPVKYKQYGEAIENALIDGLLGNKFTWLGKKMSPRVRDGEDFYEVTILVVGAGRGPLVREAIGAVARASTSLEFATSPMALHAKIIAIEKNPSAVLYLQSLKGSDPSWNDGKDPRTDDDMFDANTDEGVEIPGTSNVTVICCDMREATSHPTLRNMIMDESCRADIVVSELLGSFGDNELSPECLDGVQKCGILKNNCVSIPQRYVLLLMAVL
jgi:protein arginine N-methyltransferase 5